MNTRQRALTSFPAPCFLLALTLLLPVFFTASARAAEQDRWSTIKTSLFGTAEIRSGEQYLALEAPQRAHDASTVPVTIRALDPGHRIQRLHLIADMNPLPVAGVFRFSEDAGAWHALETRIRINEYTTVRAIAQLEDESLHMVSQLVKAAGGCSAPALSDMEVAMARAGKMQLVLDKINQANTRSPASEAVIKISHPNNSGMQFDQVSRHYIPAFYVHTIGVSVNGRQLMEIDTNFSMSENPVVRFQFDADTVVEQSSISAYALDSRGNRYQRALALDKPG